MLSISVQRLAEVSQGQQLHLIDVRTPAEFREMHAVGARNIPLDQLSASAVRGSGGVAAGETVYVICKSGSRAKQACQKLSAAGDADVVLVDGGTQAWDAAGLPVVRGQKAISLERQVRIAAGLLVILGVALAYLVHPHFMFLSAFVGAGLMFAGITDTCGMALVLAKMPWNQVRSSEGASCSV